MDTCRRIPVQWLKENYEGVLERSKRGEERGGGRSIKAKREGRIESVLGLDDDLGNEINELTGLRVSS